jgi:hypothetical protein
MMAADLAPARVATETFSLRVPQSAPTSTKLQPRTWATISRSVKLTPSFRSVGTVSPWSQQGTATAGQARKNILVADWSLNPKRFPNCPSAKYPELYITGAAKRTSLPAQTSRSDTGPFWTSLLNYCSVAILDCDPSIRSKNAMKSPPEIKFQIAILAEAPDRIEGLSDLASIEWLLCRQTGDHSFDFYKGDAIVSSIKLENARFGLQNLLGIIVVGTADEFESVKSRLSSALPSVEMNFRRIPKWDSKDILCVALECIADDLTLQRRHSGRAALELATYRREFDRLQHSFSRLEQYIGRQSFQRVTEIFEYPADSMTVTETSGRAQLDDATAPTGRCLIQDLPIDSCGLSSFSIHISAKPEAEAEPLRIKLKAIETGHIFGEWSIGADEAQVGWVEMALNEAIDEWALSLVIIVEWPPDTSGWALALGPPHPYKQFCARTEGGEHLRSPIGLRVFAGLPGVRVAATTTAIRPMNAPHVLGAFIPYEVYGTVVQVSPPIEDNKPTLVSYDRGISCITVHPRVGGLTVARMNVVVPPHAWRISAQIHLANERANPTQFALMVCAPRDETRESARLNQLDSPSPSFSGWKTLSPLETKSISLLLAESPEQQLSIYLVTRQAPDLSPDFAWARFSKFEFNVLPADMIGKNKTDNSAPFSAGFVHAGDEQAIKPAGE